MSIRKQLQFIFPEDKALSAAWTVVERNHSDKNTIVRLLNRNGATEISLPLNKFLTEGIGLKEMRPDIVQSVDLTKRNIWYVHKVVPLGNNNVIILRDFATGEQERHMPFDEFLERGVGLNDSLGKLIKAMDEQHPELIR